MSDNLTGKENTLLSQFRSLKPQDQAAIANSISMLLPKLEPTPATSEVAFDARGCATFTSELDVRGYVTTRAVHLREAFAIVGALIGQGSLDVDLEESSSATGWFNDFDVWVSAVARTLDVLDY